MPSNRVFFPQGALARWLDEGKVELAGETLTMRDGGHRYRIVEAVRVTREVTGSPDANKLVGRVKSRDFLVGLGAEIVEESMILGDNAYDVVAGFLGTLEEPQPEPVAEPPTSIEAPKAPEPPRPAVEAPPSSSSKPKAESDEDLLVKFLLKGL